MNFLIQATIVDRRGRAIPVEDKKELKDATNFSIFCLQTEVEQAKAHLKEATGHDANIVRATRIPGNMLVAYSKNVATGWSADEIKAALNPAS